MKTILTAAAVLIAAPALAQPHVSLSASAAYVSPQLAHSHGVAADFAANVRWGRLLVGVHAAELTHTRVTVGRQVEDPVTGEISIRDRRESDLDYGVVFDASYVHPVAERVALFGGLGVRFQQGNDFASSANQPDEGPVFGVQVPHLQAGALLGRTDAVHTVVRVLGRRGVEQVQVGVAVPLRF